MNEYNLFNLAMFMLTSDFDEKFEDKVAKNLSLPKVYSFSLLTDTIKDRYGLSYNDDNLVTIMNYIEEE